MSSRSAEGVIGPQLVVRGRLDGKGDLRVEGVLEGELDLEGDVAVGPDGTLVGPLRARSIEVAGEVHGDVLAGDTVAIRAGGRVQGDVRARRIAIDDGAALHGGIEMDFDLEEDEEARR
ncbi:bactofilin family protein [Sandaracinus amylolyticus]|uniref:bactofilin family protein n=1 Tax=Sandaracinus amylolyticus TaxID=927083 RepID=UPI00069FF717|nr:polymer-forming cytoskeletal protein [Sandaracinus amylolyticus]